MLTVLLLMVSFFKNFIVDILPNYLFDDANRPNDNPEVYYHQNLPYCNIRRPVSNCSEPIRTTTNKLNNSNFQPHHIPSFNSLPDRNDMSVTDLTGITAIIQKYRGKEYSSRCKPVERPQTISILSQDGCDDACESTCSVLSGLRHDSEKLIDKTRPDDPGGGCSNQKTRVYDPEISSRLQQIHILRDEIVSDNIYQQINNQSSLHFETERRQVTEHLYNQKYPETPPDTVLKPINCETKYANFETPLSSLTTKPRAVNLNDICSPEINPSIGVPPLNTVRLLPTRHRTKNAILSLLDNGEVCLEFIKMKSKYKEERVVDVYRISADGLRIVMYQPEYGQGVVPSDQPPPLPEHGADAIFSFETLPEKHCKKYLYASRFVELIRAKTPKITYYSDKAKCILMEKMSEFEACFYNGNKIFVSENEGIKIITSDGATVVLPNVKKISELSQDMQSMWRHTNNCLQYCLLLERTLSELGQNVAASNHTFPVIIGRRPASQSTSTNNNSGNNQRGKENVLGVKNCQQLIKAPPFMSTFSDTKVSFSSGDCQQSNTRVATPVTPRQVVIPDIGTAVQFASGEVQIRYLDGSVLSLDSTNKSDVIKYKVSGHQQFTIYGSGDPIPEFVRYKLTQVPLILQHMINTPPPSLSTSSVHPLKIRNHR